MDDKTKISLLYMLLGGLLGVMSAFLSVLGVPNTIMLSLYIFVVYGTTYLYFVVGVKFERLGEKRWRSALNGVFPSLLPWLVVWTMVFYLISPVIVLADVSHMETAESLEEYLESNNVRVKITEDYPRYVFAHKVVIFGSRIPIPLGTSYGVTIFPDIVQRLLGLEKDKVTVTVGTMDSVELVTIRKTGRLIIIISGHRDEIAQVLQENSDMILELLT